jgi:C4-dicarboxylate-specific signal transduction histidine kinase
MKVNKQSASKSSFSQMVAGLSHHLNNPLAAILGYSELLLRRDLDASARGMVELIHQQAERCKHTLQSLNAMTGRPSQGFQAVDLGILARECVALKTTEFEPHQIQVNQDFPAYGLIVRADPIALQQVFFHLFDNGLQALNQQSGERILSISGFNSSGWAVVQVKDSGGGIRAGGPSTSFRAILYDKIQGTESGVGFDNLPCNLAGARGSHRSGINRRTWNLRQAILT